MTTTEIARELVALNRTGKVQEAYATLYHKDAVSHETQPGPFQVSSGLEMIAKKAAWWDENFTVNSVTVSEPVVAGDFFAVAFSLDATNKAANARSTMEEIAVYEVRDGKIASERFFYALTPAS